MRGSERRNVLYLFIVIPYLCSAQDLTCKVTQVGDLTVYDITDESQVSDTDCHCSWTNRSNYALEYDVSTFRTSTCLNEIIHSRTCMPEGMERTVTCFVDCSKIKINEDKAKLEKQAMSPSMIAAVVIVPLVLVVVGIVLVLLIWHYREQIKGWCYSGSYSTTSHEEDV
ncbi:Hypothetical predicted protein [Scomber scombrus]|uniref:Uncharacterized protein n=1 Tax=Scomber scombrus TaxID=13677 RepID=A0AAV1P8Q0_SCOSC